MASEMSWLWLMGLNGVGHLRGPGGMDRWGTLRGQGAWIDMSGQHSRVGYLKVQGAWIHKSGHLSRPVGKDKWGTSQATGLE